MKVTLHLYSWLSLKSGLVRDNLNFSFSSSFYSKVLHMLLPIFEERRVLFDVQAYAEGDSCCQN